MIQNIIKLTPHHLTKRSINKYLVTCNFTQWIEHSYRNDTLKRNFIQQKNVNKSLMDNMCYIELFRVFIEFLPCHQIVNS